MSKHTPGPWIAKDGGRFDPEINITTESRHEANMHRICGIDIEFTGEFGVEQKANVHLIAAAPDLLEALIAANEFIDGIRQDLHHERVADWYPEGAHNSAAAMSESMRLIGNKCADFDVASAAIQKATGETR